MLLLHNKKSTLTSWVDMEEQWEMELSANQFTANQFQPSSFSQAVSMPSSFSQAVSAKQLSVHAGCHVTPAQQEKHPD